MVQYPITSLRAIPMSHSELGGAAISVNDLVHSWKLPRSLRLLAMTEPIYIEYLVKI